MSDLDLRRLRYFLILAEELNYGRAAEVLHMAQPALSRAITALERDLGVTLFNRSKSGTRLTPAGELLRGEARQLLLAAEVVLQRRMRRAAREGQELTIAFMPGLIVTPVARQLEEKWPGLRVQLTRTSWTGQTAGVRDGRFDACFARRPIDDERGLNIVPLYGETFVAAISGDHLLAGRDQVLLSDLVR
ncbi:hypothetical protein Kisp01_33130 [Kineosporia sp. NBRC 101677]|uniref:LysR family transcriptional regulator n=1 Tax=Kineosporia sp. NBRC 101677 TaxID=3032197 RepID=UPI0024A0009B|nr:LysR family transcriptional regulator [Kineosporia sp. NBRC 101677]GLY16298.1 hypothetical protein Kisp01_33130 [Kineosporia sp. NBRC 101677]